MKAPGSRCSKVIFRIYFTGQQISRFKSICRTFIMQSCPSGLACSWYGAKEKSESSTFNASRLFAYQCAVFQVRRPKPPACRPRIVLKHFSWLDALHLCWRCCLLNVFSLPGGQAGEGCELHWCCSVLHGMWKSNGGRTAGGQVSLHHVLGDSGAH